MKGSVGTQTHLDYSPSSLFTPLIRRIADRLPAPERLPRKTHQTRSAHGRYRFFDNTIIAHVRWLMEHGMLTRWKARELLGVNNQYMQNITAYVNYALVLPEQPTPEWIERFWAGEFARKGDAA